MSWNPEQGGPECPECGAQHDPDYDGTCKSCGWEEHKCEWEIAMIDAEREREPPGYGE